MFKQVFPADRHIAVYYPISRSGQTNHVRREEGGDNRYGNHDRVKEMARNVQAYAQRGDDESKLAYLGQTESALHGYFQRLTG